MKLLTVPLLASIVLTVVSLPAMQVLARKWKLQRRNFRGDTIPTGFGFMLAMSAVPVYAVIVTIHSHCAFISLFLLAVLGFGLLGLIDDVYGNRSVGGFVGHFGQLRHGKVSTGLIKAVGGGMLAVLIGLSAARWNVAHGFINGLVIALSANLLNLLDLRPGRAVYCFWVGVLLLIPSAFRTPSSLVEIIPVCVPAIVLTALDRSARVMLGDAGSNVLGAVLGLWMVCSSCGIVSRLLVVAFLIAVHIYAEKHSISDMIEANRFLRRLDRLLGER
jgi:UDP-N-acetylmuramyl pentapeptide phosphotransferase/UDP-N-acetylglucosamine-1-phosphate transferase